jgi:nucleoside-diphosphate-sugar epimerase
MKIFVTGATGLIGAATVRALVAHGHEVSGLTRTKANAGRIVRLGAVPVIGDMRNPKAYAAYAGTADVVIHAAAELPDKWRYSRADVDGLMGADADAVDALLRVLGPSCRRFLFTSGAYVYGDTGPEPVSEDFTTVHHHRVMARKVETENALLALERAGGPPVAIVRPGLVYGDGSLWAKLYLGAMKQHRRAFIPGDGRQVISFVHVDDVGEAYRVLAERAVPGQIYNVADDAPRPLGEVVRAQAEALRAPRPVAVPGWLVRLAAGPYGGPPPLAHNALDNTRLKGLGWRCRYPSYEEGVVALARSVRAPAG